MFQSLHMYPCRDPAIFYLLFLQLKPLESPPKRDSIQQSLPIPKFKNNNDLQQTPKKISDSSIHTKNYISLWLQKYVVLGTHCTEQTSSFSSTYVVRSSQYLFCIPSMILWRAELKRRGVAPPAPTVPRKGATGWHRRRRHRWRPRVVPCMHQQRHRSLCAGQGCRAKPWHHRRSRRAGVPRRATGGALQYAIVAPQSGAPLQLVAPFGGSCGRAPL